MRWAAVALALSLAAAIVASVTLAENALHIPPDARVRADRSTAEGWARAENATWGDATIHAADGVVLRGWLFKPKQAAGKAAILLHGVGDTRRGVLWQAGMLLRHGYAVLTPDSRGHGESGGTMVTYGVKEAEDVRRWAQWMSGAEGFGPLYGLGESLGAAVLLQAISKPTPFRAVVAECPFATFEQIGLYRLQQVSGLGGPQWLPLVRLAFLYTRWRYGVDLDQASPARCAAVWRVPVLLIHGAADTNIPPSHSRTLRALNPGQATLWEVAGAPHVAAWVTAPWEYESRVAGWFAAYP